MCGSRPCVVPRGYPRDPRTLGERIRQRRMDLALTQRTLAERLGVREETVHLWETGRARPVPRHYGVIIRVLELDPAPSAGTLPERLRSIRLGLGLTQEQMAEKLGLDEGSLSRWESGSRQPSRWMAGRLACLLDAIEAGHGHAPASSSLSYFDLTRWRRRPPSDLLAVEPETLGERIRQVRITRGMSQAAAARLFGVLRGTLYRWERDVAAVPRTRLPVVRRFMTEKSGLRRRKG